MPKGAHTHAAGDTERRAACWHEVPGADFVCVGQRLRVVSGALVGVIQTFFSFCVFFPRTAGAFFRGPAVRIPLLTKTWVP